jgi:alkanesulfonate monooxygenase SsuD/methylene tetrahydromethanopterin reductase-like flavin-dependent oxidoreductase (luciferase family)
MGDLRVGIVLRQQDLEQHGRRLSQLTAEVAAAGIDHVTVGDHVSFAGGMGADGLIQATALLAAHPTLPVETGVYLLPLRHPATVARQLATLSSLAPGRLAFGVGVGGDDRRELELCGVDPRTRGARMDESLALLRAFLTGDEVSFEGRFFAVQQGRIRPAPSPPLPIVVGGRSDAALARAGRLGDGWIGVWVSPRRFREAVGKVAAAAAAHGRELAARRHALQLWAGFAGTRDAAERRVGAAMERAYGIPFERFSKYVPRGTPADVAAALQPYLDAGCRRLSIVPEAGGLAAAIEAVGAVRQLLI